MVQRTGNERVERGVQDSTVDEYRRETSSIDDYIVHQPENIRPMLEQVRQCIAAAAPHAIEKISWRMPTFWQEEDLVHFGVFKKHLGIYPGALTDAPFKDKLKRYHTSTGTVQFPYDKPIDFDLIAQITRWRVDCVEAKHRLNEKLYEFETVIQSVDRGGAYVAFPHNVREEFGKGRVKVHATFDGVPYDGSITNMGMKNPDGSVCYILIILKKIRADLGKQAGDSVTVTVKERA